MPAPSGSSNEGNVLPVAAMPLRLASLKHLFKRNAVRGQMRSGVLGRTDHLRLLLLCDERALGNSQRVRLRTVEGRFGRQRAMFSSRVTAWFTAPVAAGRIALVTIEPPDVGPSGKEVSPRKTSMRSRGTPVFACSHLREKRVSAGADILCGAAHANAAIGTQLNGRSAGNARRRPRSARQTPCR